MTKQEDYLKDIHSSGKHLLSLINDILDCRRSRRDEWSSSHELRCIAALSNAMTLIRERAQRHGIALGQDG
jgi:signal transduction histidine kinase